MRSKKRDVRWGCVEKPKARRIGSCGTYKDCIRHCERLVLRGKSHWAKDLWERDPMRSASWFPGRCLTPAWWNLGEARIDDLSRCSVCHRKSFVSFFFTFCRLRRQGWRCTHVATLAKIGVHIAFLRVEIEWYYGFRWLRDRLSFIHYLSI